eukprot:CAMPEP_0175293294 /NCGR_PEP_ID=MMETSP0093-20121207/57396_1 /TAXON_ID=311494 /ORGANISM="Alexandrium monilatum, Strain CCMP3105" /LENGTH=30 /DNA_ID= /DNA_START= /DNA_END= /DNA_ORIENTATION=
MSAKQKSDSRGIDVVVKTVVASAVDAASEA